MTRFDFTGKTVILTGGTGDIGKAAAKMFLQAGANVVVADCLEKPEVMKELLEISPNAAFVKCDITVWEEDENLVAETVKRFGRLDILVNNAGINAQKPERKPFPEFRREFWDKVISVNVNGTFYLSQIACRQMIAQGEEGGSIINISSVAGINPLRMQCAFPVAKAGVLMMSRVMAVELAQYNIRVNCICPGSILTEKTYAKFYSDREKSESLLSHVPMHRPGTTDEIAYGILCLASEEASYMTGSNLVIDGGWTCGFMRDW